MSAAAYELVPSENDDNDNSRVSQSTLKNTRNPPRFRKLVLLTAAFCLVAFIAFKSGQWSVARHPLSDSLNQAEETIEEQDEVAAVDKPVVANDTDYSEMPGNGKYSVG